jgi:hypothetical protein
MELGTGGMGPAVSSRRETHGLETQKTIQRDPARTLPLDMGRDKECLRSAFTAFFESRARRPRFKSKKKSKPSLYLANDQFALKDHHVWIPKLGWVNMAENLRFKGKVTGARVTRTADWWFISVTVEMADETLEKRKPAVGIDVGLNRLATDAVRERESRTKPSSKPRSKSCVKPINDCIAASKGQKTGRKRGGSWLGCTTRSPACVMMFCRS